MPSSLYKLFLIFGFSVLVSACDEATTTVEPGILHGLALERLDGSSEAMKTYAGKIVVLNLWATWCAPCKIEMPDLEALKNKVNSEKIAVIGLSIDKDASKAQAYLSEAQITFAEYIDPGQKQTRKLFKVQGLPTTLIFNAKGTIAHQVVGVREWKSDKIIDLLNDLYEGKALSETAFD